MKLTFSFEANTINEVKKTLSELAGSFDNLIDPLIEDSDEFNIFTSSEGKEVQIVPSLKIDKNLEITIENKILKYLNEDFGIQDVKSDMPFKELGLDSLDLIDVILQIEDEFDVEISDYDAEYMYTIKDVVDYIKEKKCGCCS